MQTRHPLRKKMGIYRIKCLITDKIYVGSSVNLQHRWISHRSVLLMNKHNNGYLQKAWNKHGEKNFVFDVLEFIDDKEILLLVEERWIRNLCSGADKFGYNLIENCSKPLRVGGYHKQPKIPKVKGPRKKLSQETKDRMSVAKTGIKPSPESLLKAAETRKKHGPYIRTPEMLEAMSKRMLGKPGWNKGLVGILSHSFGRKVSEQVKKRLSDNAKGKNWGQGLALRKPIVGINSLGDVIRFESQAEGQRQGYTNISRAMSRGHRVKGYLFEFDTHE